MIDEATALIKAIDTQTPQVMIEAKIVEANLDFSREVGSRWGVGVAAASSTPSTETAALDEDLGGNDFTLHDNRCGRPVNATTPNNVAVSNPITELATGVAEPRRLPARRAASTSTLALEAAESDGEGKVISSPRVVTLDNRKASIEQGVSIPFQTFENGDAKLEFIDAVLQLDVTPHITADRSIIMKIEVQRNAPDDSVPTPTGSPAIAKNEAETETLVQGRPDAGDRRHLRGADGRAPVPRAVLPQDPGARERLQEQRDARRAPGAPGVRDAAHGGEPRVGS